MLVGRQSWRFEKQPVILASAVVGGPFETQSPLKDDFDMFYEDTWLGQASFEQAESKMLEEACMKVLEKADLKSEDINFLLCGDLGNQITSSNFAARTLSIPYLGLFGACSTAMESLALGAKLLDNGGARYIIAATTSHNSAAEKQFRYPTEYGAQKPPTAQWTVTGAGAVVLGNEGSGLKVTSVTIGKVVDMGISDPFNMGAAMAPAAVDTIETHLRELNVEPEYYDLITTGDLGFTGYDIANELFKKHGIKLKEDLFTDCGMLIYGKNPKVFSGGSGCACCATVTYGHLFNRMRSGELKRILVTATGALLSPMSYQQKQTIPCIAHSVSIEYMQ